MSAASRQPFFAQHLYNFKRTFHYFKTGLFNGLPAQIKYGHPEKKLKVICVTGTDGKTTSSFLIYHLLKKVGLKVGLISTVGAYIGDKEVDTGLHVTSPSPAELYQLMAQMAQKKLEYLVLETTSQGIYQYRTWGIKPYLTALTNLDSEHLDYHLNTNNYWAAKILLLRQSERVVLNADLPQLNLIEKELPKVTKKIFYGSKINFSRPLESATKKNIIEDYNLLNTRLAITVVKTLIPQLEEQILAEALISFKLPAGRMELVANNRGLTIVVDFAHTPQAIEAVLSNLRRNYLTKGGRLISIFGCSGRRDAQKRPVMGRLGAQYSDFAIFTADDPRDENIWSIFNQMKGDLSPYHDRVITIANRADAIDFVFNHLVRPGDTIALLGKGHEKSLAMAEGEIEWNDTQYVKKILQKKNRAR